jgi:hypothetical protein
VHRIAAVEPTAFHPDPYLPFIHETLAKFPTLRASRLHTMVQERGYRGGQSQFRHIIACHRPRPSSFNSTKEKKRLLRSLPSRKRETMVMPSEVEQGGIEADGVAAALQHGTSQVVVQNDSRHRVPDREGADMAAQEVFRAGIEKEAQEDLAREAQDRDKSHQRPAGPADHDMAKMSADANKLPPPSATA